MENRTNKTNVLWITVSKKCLPSNTTIHSTSKNTVIVRIITRHMVVIIMINIQVKHANTQCRTIMQQQHIVTKQEAQYKPKLEFPTKE